MFNKDAGLCRQRPLGGSAPAPSTGWQRPSQWLAIPAVGASEEVFYGLHAVWDTTVNPCAFLMNGTGAGYTVDWGDGTTSNHAMNTVAQKNFAYSDLSGTPFRGYRQALIKITPQAGAVINSVDLCRRHSSYAYKYSTSFLEIVCNIETQNNAIPFNNGGLVFHPYVESVFYKKHTSTNLQNLFTDFYSLQKVNTFNTGHCTGIQSKFQRCYLLQEIPEFNYSNVTNASYAFDSCSALKKIKTNDFRKVTNATYMTGGCPSLNDLSNVQFRDVTNMDLFNYPGGRLTNLPDLSLANSIVGSLNYAFYTNGSLKILPYINLAGSTNITDIFAGTLPARTVIRSLLVGATRSHGFYVNQLLDAAALNEIFTNLGTAISGATLTITGNPGVGTCNQSIATSKGWTIVN